MEMHCFDCDEFYDSADYPDVDIDTCPLCGSTDVELVPEDDDEIWEDEEETEDERELE